MMNIFEEVRKIAESTTNEYLDKAIAEGKKAVGYFGSYTPIEMIHAAGFVPYQMRAVGSTSMELGDTFYSSLNCTFVRHCFDKVLRGEFDFLEGVVFSNGCDHTRRMYDNWRYSDAKLDYHHMFVIPHILGEHAFERYYEECLKFKKAFEEHFGVEITDEALKNSIAIYNKQRSLLAKLNSMRVADAVPIKGSEFVALMLVVTAVPVEDSIHIIEDVIKACEGRNVVNDGDVRILLASGHMEEIEHVELLEQGGAVIVADMLCQGIRNYDGLTDENEDAIRALTKRYMTHLSCPRMINDTKGRLNCFHQLRDTHKVEGVIIDRLKFCDLWGGEAFIFKQEGMRRNFPFIKLERELRGGSSGQILTRAQAFYEQIRNSRN